MEIMTSEHITAPTHDYPFCKTSEEYERLSKQAKMWEFSTLRIFRQVGLSEGMSCLDVGCGTGAVMRLMGEMVGPMGSVTGIDMNGDAGRQAVEMLRAATNSRFSFIEQDLDAVSDGPGGPFDLTFARKVIIHLRNPIAMLQKMYAWTKPGGYIVVQDYDTSAWDIHPWLEAWGKLRKLLDDVFASSDSKFGHKLPAHFVDAGIGDPDGADVAGVMGSLAQYGEMCRDSYRNLIPYAVRMGLTTEAESESVIEDMKRAEKSAQYYSVRFPLLIGVWKRKPL
jgi:ubiquinone/menaquinone biosynthesis C-methylase UbiE